MSTGASDNERGRNSRCTMLTSAFASWCFAQDFLPFRIVLKKAFVQVRQGSANRTYLVSGKYVRRNRSCFGKEISFSRLCWKKLFYPQSTLQTWLVNHILIMISPSVSACHNHRQRLQVYNRTWA